MPLPREHGAWGMLLTPLVLGAAVLGLGVRGVLLSLVAVFFYLAHEPMDRLAKRGGGRGVDGEARALRSWLYCYLGGGVVAASPLLAAGRPQLLIPVGLAAFAVLAVVLWLSHHGYRYSLYTRVLAAAGLSLGALAYAAAQTGQISTTAWALTFFTFLFFLGSIYRVRVHLRAHRNSRFRLASFWGHLGILAAAILAAFMRLAPALAPLSLVPGVYQALVLLKRGPSPLSPKALGMRELRLNLLFAGLLAAAYWVG